MIREWRILTDDDGYTISIRGPDGKEHSFAGFALFAGDGFSGGSLIVVQGASADAAFAFVRGYDQPALAAFYKSCALQFMRALSPEAFRQEVEAEKVLGRWEREDGGNGKAM